MPDWRHDVAKTASRTGALVAASAMAAVAWHELEHRRVRRAELTDAHVRVERLSDLRDDRQALEAIARGLGEEWGPFAFLGFEDVALMAAEAGESIFVASEVGRSSRTPLAVLQTIILDCHGDPNWLRAAYPKFQELTGAQTWRLSRSHGGDTAILLQITTLGRDERGAGLGSQLRNAALHMLPKEIRYALTTTPVDVGPDKPELDIADAKTFTPAMKFHARGGAEPTVVLLKFKAPADRRRRGAGRHGSDVVVMRYVRDAEGNWSAPRPHMRLRSMGPIEQRLVHTADRLGSLRSLEDRLGRRVRQRLSALRPVEERLAQTARRLGSLGRHRVAGHEAIAPD